MVLVGKNQKEVMSVNDVVEFTYTAKTQYVSYAYKTTNTGKAW